MLFIAKMVEMCFGSVGIWAVVVCFSLDLEGLLFLRYNNDPQTGVIIMYLVWSFK